MNSMTIPLFPLHTVLFPQGLLPLRIFEPRYLGMVSQCLRENSGFGVCLIQQGSEVGQAAETYPIGTLANIINFDQRADGLLGIDVMGQQRFRVLQTHVNNNQLIEAQIELIDNEPEYPLPNEYQNLAVFLEEFINQLDDFYKNQLGQHYTQASWVGQRLAELLPFALPLRQTFLEMNDPIHRLKQIHHTLNVLKVCL